MPGRDTDSCVPASRTTLSQRLLLPKAMKRQIKRPWMTIRRRWLLIKQIAKHAMMRGSGGRQFSRSSSRLRKILLLILSARAGDRYGRKAIHELTRNGTKTQALFRVISCEFVDRFSLGRQSRDDCRAGATGNY